MTQRRLALLAKVSTPTISRFEGGEKNIELSSILSILDVLGMTSHRVLIFPAPHERVDFDRDVIVFFGMDGEKKVTCAISKNALDDYFKSDGQPSLKTFASNHKFIEHEARRKYLTDRLEEDGSVLIRSRDLS